MTIDKGRFEKGAARLLSPNAEHLCSDIDRRTMKMPNNIDDPTTSGPNSTRFFSRIRILASLLSRPRQNTAQVWFKNRRAKCRQQVKQQQQHNSNEKSSSRSSSGQPSSKSKSNSSSISSNSVGLANQTNASAAAAAAASKNAVSAVPPTTLANITAAHHNSACNSSNSSASNNTSNSSASSPAAVLPSHHRDIKPLLSATPPVAAAYSSGTNYEYRDPRPATAESRKPEAEAASKLDSRMRNRPNGQFIVHKRRCRLAQSVYLLKCETHVSSICAGLKGGRVKRRSNAGIWSPVVIDSCLEPHHRTSTTVSASSGGYANQSGSVVAASTPHSANCYPPPHHHHHHHHSHHQNYPSYYSNMDYHLSPTPAMSHAHLSNISYTSSSCLNFSSRCLNFRLFHFEFFKPKKERRKTRLDSASRVVVRFSGSLSPVLTPQCSSPVVDSYSRGRPCVFGVRRLGIFVRVVGGWPVGRLTGGPPERSYVSISVSPGAAAGRQQTADKLKFRYSPLVALRATYRQVRICSFFQQLIARAVISLIRFLFALRPPAPTAAASTVECRVSSVDRRPDGIAAVRLPCQIRVKRVEKKSNRNSRRRPRAPSADSIVGRRLYAIDYIDYKTTDNYSRPTIRTRFQLGWATLAVVHNCGFASRRVASPRAQKSRKCGPTFPHPPPGHRAIRASVIDYDSFEYADRFEDATHAYTDTLDEAFHKSCKTTFRFA
ncbi:hypothetical protein V9T40_002949 [Parthenolecanium corni]|uniref:Homeobox domain-containing protein n=1 Tax=Parthenolecanium corni TaxID=536013 RepID=A0AAN9TXQ0_9HEMI